MLAFQLKTETPADIIQARWYGKYIGAAWNWLQMEKTELQNLYTEEIPPQKHANHNIF